MPGMHTYAYMPKMCCLC